MTLCTKTLFCAPDAPPSPADLSAIAVGVASGKIIVFPTDTVYGIGTTARNNSARERLYALKDRDPRKALPILVHSLDDARLWAEFTPEAEILARKYWPGALTLVLSVTRKGRRIVSEGAATIALRIPALALTRELIELSGVPWATTSANRSGEPACADGTAAADVFSGRVDFIVDAGPGAGQPSTVVDATGGTLKILRAGALSASEVLG
ncbi:MAG: threonylcarbamoyl-AMP synthase [Elusimicrobia bacterium CG_4_9_14_3_um_filter_62_55]|nr:MAG: threonylcarbamoyl-AMP synthase [Elusimicrobia bacterium CG22_combo_CG10-13_8_21_14_all_63_91]PJA12200.1 MAG: threonylcarbamoyl-AMP synthase [Elusimicrobia bacterium CG_4_10_14_0_2_um_filter_63_34]PJB23465.1 MAG: threonylcarbamoyl-AMP synthase [Elusimicrobia bacterium CG_4_9_14_3_um_filter_62_55]